MAYPNSVILLRAGGHFGTMTTFPDRWSTGLRFGIVGADVPYNETNLQTFADSAWNAFSTLHATAATLVGSSCYLDYTTAARVGTDGKYDPTTQNTVRHDGTPLPGNGSGTLPWNSALVVSLRTNRPRGYASNGRMYYPMLVTTITGTTGRIPAGTVASRVAVFKTLIEALNVAAQTYAVNMRLVVASSVGAGLQAKVISIRSDDRVDSIERRENDTPSNWSTASITQT